MQDCGIVILATSNENYLKMAYNLALSIKKPNCLCKIQLICDSYIHERLTNIHRNTFDYIDVIETGDKSFSWHKTRIYDYTNRFERNLFVDADSLFFPTYNLYKLFDVLQGSDFISFGAKKENVNDKNSYLSFYNGNIYEIFKSFASNKKIFHNIYTSFFYFERTFNTSQYFNTVKSVYDKLSEDIERQDQIVKWRNTIPDELAFSVASNISGLKINTEVTKQTDFLKAWKSMNSFDYFSALIHMIDSCGITMIGEIPNKNMISFYNYIIRILNMKYNVEFYELKFENNIKLVEQ